MPIELFFIAVIQAPLELTLTVAELNLAKNNYEDSSKNLSELNL